MTTANLREVVTPIGSKDPQRPLVLFLPGLSGNLAQWTAVIAELEEEPVDLAYGAAILPHPAFGDSRPTVMGVVSAIAAQLRRDGRSDVIVVAHSVGSFVALGLARVAPDAVRAVVLVNGGLVHVAKFLDHPVREMLTAPQTCLASLRLFALLGAPAPRNMKRAIANSEKSSRLLLGGLVSDSTLDSADQRSRLIAEAGSPQTMRALWDNRHHWREFKSYAHEVNRRVVFLVGDQDPMSSEQESRAMAAMLPNAEVNVLKGVGHAAPVETATAVAETIREILAV